MLIAAVVPAAMCLVLWIVISYGQQSRLFFNMGNHLSCSNSKAGCIGFALIGVPLLAVGIVLLVGLLLHLVGVRPAWPIVLLGPVIALIIGHLGQRYFLAGAPLTWFTATLGVAVSYAAAAFLAMSRGHTHLRIGLAVAIFALLLLSLL